ncbi:IQ domain-containing protein M isoform X1 [Anas platyrhynchos]|uniref:IQ domain-containing protein M isoform X1 n=2 Tax=Anas platyrhynchos TaxID=8839 RepID=UPI0018D846A7|nr:IQ domain-containing protein M isoform X1 [Anas platyrhynchos]XP_038034730.1 IQ domain-containing protein M isoform X1 [Anas platyrhynchos]XP_038034731.1 IQ domain-containing protein M isoform X1 [Anas platyrhynchos]XP_038034733.1 IQ domain-containing protein M isoform X1 [Anas platyrhynchos]XP_038034734.1 IQ domain-containing protein M isoform X1 [Anas platyrhynchos]XP_038034735.1 IQ domain-containing protein M isoform X1 [Anas platyrhynchos]XP_038034736.1 IQ domain-containing protein M i
MKLKCNGSMSSQKLSVPYCSWGSTQTPVSASSILENAKSYDNEVFGIERPKRNFQQDSWLEEKFYKALETPLTVMYNRAFPDKAVKCYKAYIYLSPQYTVEQEERISITELLSGIDTVSRALKNEKKEKFSSLSRSLDSPSASPRPCDIPGFQITHKGKVYQDWRGVIVPNPEKEHDQMRQKCIRVKGKKIDFPVYKKKSAASGAKSERRENCQKFSQKVRKLSDKRLSLQTQKKEKKNVTHLEDFGAFCDCTKDPGSREVLKAVICIQRYVRGWLVRRAFKRVKIKSASHGPSLLAVVRYYRKMMTRIKHRAGVLDLSTPLHYFELEEWMDKKKFYEAMFFKRELDKKMDRKQLSEFFRDCGYFIPASGIHQVFQLVSPASTASVRSIKKHQAIEMAFTLFPPLGAKVKNVVTVPLPWLHPLLDGKVGSKKAAFSRKKSKKTDFQVSAALVISSMKEQEKKTPL